MRETRKFDWIQLLLAMASSETRAELVCARTPGAGGHGARPCLHFIGRAVCASRDSCRGRNRSRR